MPANGNESFGNKGYWQATTLLYSFGHAVVSFVETRKPDVVCLASLHSNAVYNGS